MTEKTRQELLDRIDELEEQNRLLRKNQDYLERQLEEAGGAVWQRLQKEFAQTLEKTGLKF